MVEDSPEGEFVSLIGEVAPAALEDELLFGPRDVIQDEGWGPMDEGWGREDGWGPGEDGWGPGEEVLDPLLAILSTSKAIPRLMPTFLGIVQHGKYC